MTTTYTTKITSTIHDMMIMSGASGDLAANIAEIVTTIIRENPKVLHMIADPVISDDTINGLVSKAFEVCRHALQQAIDNPAEFAAFISAN